MNLLASLFISAIRFNHRALGGSFQKANRSPHGSVQRMKMEALQTSKLVIVSGERGGNIDHDFRNRCDTPTMRKLFRNGAVVHCVGVAKAAA